jgi:hypothetical protein
MSIVIIGGNECMIGRYRDICREYGCKSKVFAKPESDLDGMIGKPDLIVIFTNPVSHKMVRIAKKRAANHGIKLEQSHSGSGNALRNILNGYAKKACC